MNSKFDLDAFLAEVEVADDAEKEVVKKFFSREKNQAKVLTQSEFSKKMDGLSAQEKALSEKAQKTLADLEAKQKSLDDLITRNIAYKGEADKAVELKQKEVEKLRAKALKAAEAAGYDLDEIEDDDLLAPKRPAFDENEFLNKLKPQFVTPDVLDRLATGHINLTLELDEIKETYSELYPNKRLSKVQKEELLREYNEDVAKYLKAHPSHQPPPLMDTASRLYDFSKVRNEREDARIKKLIDDARADERAKVIKEASDQGLPAPRRGGPQSPFALRTRKEGEKPTEGRGIRLALEALEKARTGTAA